MDKIFGNLITICSYIFTFKHLFSRLSRMRS